MPSENLLVRTLTALADAGVRFVVCGGVACILQGVARATHDLDLRVALDEANLRAFLDVARALGLRPRLPEPIDALLDPERRADWITTEHAVVYTLLTDDGAFSVDVFLRYPIAFADLVAEADTVDVEGRVVRISSIGHLIEAKRAVVPPRKQDLRDIEDLTELLDARS